MTISGHINLINNPQAFFGQLLTGTKKPTTGFAPAKMPGFSVTMTSVFMGFIPITIPGTFNPADGSFTLPAVPPQLPGFGPNDLVSLNVTLHGTPFYRTERFPHAHLTEDLEIFVYQPNIPASDGIAAGLISKGLNGQGLPSDTKLTANPWGIGVAGDQSGADVQFGISLIPDTSPNLAVFFDMALHNWNIHVGWPASCVTSADGILAKIRASLQSSDSAANKLVSGAITKALEAPPLNVPATLTQSILNLVSIQFVSLSLPHPHTWALSNETDSTIVVNPQVTFGFPRGF